MTRRDARMRARAPRPARRAGSLRRPEGALSSGPPPPSPPQPSLAAVPDADTYARVRTRTHPEPRTDRATHAPVRRTHARSSLLDGRTDRRARGRRHARSHGSARARTHARVCVCARSILRRGSPRSHRAGPSQTPAPAPAPAVLGTYRHPFSSSSSGSESQTPARMGIREVHSPAGADLKAAICPRYIQLIRVRSESEFHSKVHSDPSQKVTHKFTQIRVRSSLAGRCSRPSCASPATSTSPPSPGAHAPHAHARTDTRLV